MNYPAGFSAAAAGGRPGAAHGSLGLGLQDTPWNECEKVGFSSEQESPSALLTLGSLAWSLLNVWVCGYFVGLSVS